jgi:spore germination protein YaaH
MTRGSELNCWADEGRLFNLTVNLPAEGGFGIRTSGAAIECSLLDAGSPYTYVPQEAVEVIVKLDQYNTGVRYNSGARANVLPATFGRIQRSGVTWLEPWGYFEYLGAGEEADTRTEEIPLDFDFVHTAMFPAFEGDRPVVINLSDRGVWVTNLYLGDARGFSLAHYSDAEHFDMPANLANHRWGLKGVSWWALGLQDPRVFQYREGVG